MCSTSNRFRNNVIREFLHFYLFSFSICFPCVWFVLFVVVVVVAVDDDDDDDDDDDNDTFIRRFLFLSWENDLQPQSTACKYRW